MKPIFDILTTIASRHLDIPTLLERRSDSLDFHEVSVWGVKDALWYAYQAGLNGRDSIASTSAVGHIRTAVLKAKAADVTCKAVSDIDSTQKPFSVLLLRPDDHDDGGRKTYYGWVHAADPLQAVAVAVARAKAAASREDANIRPDHFAPLLVTQGHHLGEDLFTR